MRIIGSAAIQKRTAVRIASREGMQITFSLSQAFLTISSVHRGFWRRFQENTIAGALDTFSFVPNTPM